MASYNMDSLRKNNIKKVRAIVWNNILSKKDIISNRTLTALIDKYYKHENSKAFLVRLNNKVNQYEKPKPDYKKNGTNFITNDPVDVKLTSKALKTIKSDEKAMIEQGKFKLRSFLKNNSDKVVSFYLSIYIEILMDERDKYPNSIVYDSKAWTPSSRGISKDDLRSFYFEKSVPGIKHQFIMNKLRKYKYVTSDEFNTKGNEFHTLISDFDEYMNFIDYYNNVNVSYNTLIRVFEIHYGSSVNQPINYISEKAFDDGSNLHLSNKYIDCNLLKPYYNSTYVKENFKPRSCWVSLLLDVFKIPIEKYYKKIKLTYESINEIIGDCPLSDEGNGYSFQQVVKFFEKFTLNLYMFDVTFNLVQSYEADRKNFNISPRSLYVIFHNGHIYHANNELNSLYHKPDALEVKPIIKEPSDKYYIMKHKEIDNMTRIIFNFEDLKKIIFDDKIEGNINLFYNHGCFDLWIRLYEELKYEAIIILKDGQLNFDTIILKNINKKNITISTHSETGVTLDKQFEYENILHNYLDKRNMVLAKLLNKNYISSYSNQVLQMMNDYSGNVLTGCFENIYDETECIEIDYNKFYTSILQDIKEIPIINSFDNFCCYKGETIMEYNLYFVEKKDDCLEYPLNHFSLCYGINIKDITSKLTIHSVLVPSKIKSNIAGGIIEEVYNDVSLDMKMKKDIFNHTIGMYAKKYNKSSFSLISNSREEANKHKASYGGVVKVISTENKKYYLNYIESQKELRNGFKLISHMIFDFANKRLFDLKKKAECYGLIVLKCNTDCLMLNNDTEKFETFYNENCELFHESAIGKLKIKNKKIGGGSFVESKRFKNLYQPTVLYSSEHVLIDEWNRDEIHQKITDNNYMIIKADIAGAGKTSSFVSYAKKHNKRCLFVCPWNSLCFSLRNDGNDSVTLDKLLGFRFDGVDSIQGKELVLDDYEMIVFDEIFLYDTFKLQCISDFMKSHNLRYYATGDEHQLKPIETLSISDTKTYYKNIVNSMFYNIITLHDNKRCKTKEDQLRIKTITNAIRESSSKEIAIEILKNNFKIITDKKDLKDKKNVVGLNMTAEWVNTLIHEELEGQKYYGGLNLICRKSYKNKNLKLFVNYTYEILSIEDDVFWITDNEDFYYVNKSIIQSHFRLSYAKTCNSYQGMSENESMTIFDINHFMVDVDWIYTAITRCVYLDKISVYLGKTDFQENISNLKIQVKSMIDGHIHADFSNDRLCLNEKYVSTEWVLKLLKTTNRCCECHSHLDVSKPECFSIDRIDNNLGHYEMNCRIICRRCNNAKK